MGTFFIIIWDIVRKSIWPNNAFGLFGRISSALSMAALLVFGFNYGFAPVFLKLFEWWDWFLGVVASRTGLGALAHLILAWAGSWFDLDFVLHPHWKHVFFLMGVFIFRGALTAYEGGYPATGTFDLLWGLVTGLAASAGAGAVALTQADLWANFLIAAIPLASLLVYSLVQHAWRATFLRTRYAKLYRVPTPTWWAHFSSGVRWTLWRTVIGLVVIAAGLPLLRGAESPGLALLLLLVLFLASFWLWHSVGSARAIKGPEESFRAAYRRTAGAKLGAGMLGIFFWTLVFIAASAGLDLIPRAALIDLS